MHFLSRRQFLFGSGALALLSAAISIPQCGEYPQSQLPLQTLSNKEAYIYQILGDWLIPSGGTIPGSGGDDITITRIDKLLTHLPAGQQTLLSALPLVFEHGTALDRFAAKRMTALSTQERDEYLRSWIESTYLIPAQLIAALRTIFALTYFERIDVQTAMTIPPSCVPI
jgi:hypothetical protein